MNISSTLQSPKPDRFFAPSTTKLVLLSLLSFGLYQAYWFYKNWEAMNYSGYKKVVPWARMLVYPLLAYSCFEWIQAAAKKCGITVKWSAAFLAVALLAITCAPMLWDWLDYLAYLNFLPMIYANNLAIAVNERLVPGFESDSKITGADISTVIIGAAFFLIVTGSNYIANRFVGVFPQLQTLQDLQALQYGI